MRITGKEWSTMTVEKRIKKLEEAVNNNQLRRENEKATAATVTR